MNRYKQQFKNHFIFPFILFKIFFIIYLFKHNVYIHQIKLKYKQIVFIQKLITNYL